MTSTKNSLTPFDKLPTSVFEQILNLLNDEVIAPFHLVSKYLFSRVYEYIRHGRENSRRERERRIKQLYGNSYMNAPRWVLAGRYEYIRRIYMKLKPRFYRLALFVGRITPKEGAILIDAYKDALSYSIWRTVCEDKINNFIYYDELNFEFEQIQSFYKHNISYRMLFDCQNSTCLYIISKRKSETDLPISARIRGNQVIKDLSERPYLSPSSVKKDEKPGSEIRA